MKYAIKDPVTELYYRTGTYSWTYDLEKARIYEKVSSANRAMPHVREDLNEIWCWKNKYGSFDIRPYPPPQHAIRVKVVEATKLVEVR